MALASAYAIGGSNAWNPMGVLILGVATVATIAVLVPWDKVGRSISGGWSWIAKQARTVAKRVSDSFARAVPRKYRSPKEVHHLVAQGRTN
ncbi:hypothetical protein [Clostridium grantii]|nr:hypothetical protein [Clostridium grantii]